MKNEYIDAYDRVVIQSGVASSYFIYALHHTDANHIQVGFGMEAKSGLQRAHLPGPNVHEFHVEALAKWLEAGGSLVLGDERPPRIHPFSSTMDINLPEKLAESEVIPLTAGRFISAISDTTLRSEQFRGQLAAVIRRVQLMAFAHPLDWDVQHHDLADGRFIWMAYDATLKKIRVGLGFFNETGDRQYGTHTYALGVREVPGFVAHHFTLLDAPLQFLGVPPRWPPSMSVFVTGPGKQGFTGALLTLADKVWPGQLG